MHELGHSLGLLHTWNQDDGCDDTPRNAGCWGDTCSNNMMDYNASQSALTACQLGIIHYYLYVIGVSRCKSITVGVFHGPTRLFFGSLFVPIPVLALRAHGLDALDSGQPGVAAP